MKKISGRNSKNLIIQSIFSAQKKSFFKSTIYLYLTLIKTEIKLNKKGRKIIRKTKVNSVEVNFIS